MKKLKVLISDSYDPWFNLATEDWIFRELDPSYHVLFLWRNKETVVIGRFQNPWVECDLEKMKADEVKLARRQSGGGAVFHDLGNTNFTFLTGKASYSKDDNFNIIINALKKYNIQAERSGRNDLLVDGQKFSGSAFKENRDRCFHHGTLLIDADLTRLSNYLNPDPKKLESKGITSVKSRVTNLIEHNKEIGHEQLTEEITKAFFEYYESSCEVEVLHPDKLKEIPGLIKYYEMLKDWDWRFGETPKFNHQLDERFTWGGMDVHIDSHKGQIIDCQIFSDSLHPEMVEILMEKLRGVSYSTEGVALACEKSIEELPMIKEYIEEFGNWLKNAI